MRLLRLEDDGEFSMIQRYRENIPPYAILSHTWSEADDDEVSFKDILKKRSESKKKPGYSKLLFCAGQAAADGIEYFWIDTCCINQSSSAELSEAINSMFQWYQNARRCYVYLNDPSITFLPFEFSKDNQDLRRLLKDSFWKCRWLKRGWTLQELLAPKSVEFFTPLGRRIGDKISLTQHIHKATKIPISALQGQPMSHFSIDERLSWAEGRDTKREEDAAYSLMGLFDLHMPLIYGEGRAKAFIRLRREIQAASDLEDKHSQIQPQQERTSPKSEDAKVELGIETSQWNRPSYHKNVSPPMIMKGWWDSATVVQTLPSGYRKVAVLLLKWADEIDDLKVRGEVEELETVFRGIFHFHTSLVELDALRKPQHQINRLLDNFIEQHDGPDSLLVLHYSGHSYYYGDNAQLVLIPYYLRPSREISVNWSRIQTSLAEDVEGDVLTLLDTCFTSDRMFSSSRPTRRGPGRKGQVDKRKFELLSACALESTTAGPGPNSFTRALIDALTDLAFDSRGESFTTFHLNQRILLNPKRRDTPSLLWSLTRHDHHIRLAPLVPVDERERLLSNPKHNPRGYLRLGIPLPTESLNFDQIDFLAGQLTRTFCHQLIRGGRIDWLGIEHMAQHRFVIAALVMFAVVRFKEPLRKREELRGFRYRQFAQIALGHPLDVSNKNTG